MGGEKNHLYSQADVTYESKKRVNVKTSQQFQRLSITNSAAIIAAANTISEQTQALQGLANKPPIGIPYDDTIGIIGLVTQAIFLDVYGSQYTFVTLNNDTAFGFENIPQGKFIEFTLDILIDTGGSPPVVAINFPVDLLNAPILPGTDGDHYVLKFIGVNRADQDGVDAAGTTTFTLIGGTETSGGEFFGPWTANHNAGLQDLINLNNIDFNGVASTIQGLHNLDFFQASHSINSVSGTMLFQTAALDEFLFTIGGVSAFKINEPASGVYEIDMLTHKIDNAKSILFSGSETFPGTAYGIGIDGITDNLEYNVPVGEVHDFNVNDLSMIRIGLNGVTIDAVNSPTGSFTGPQLQLNAVVASPVIPGQFTMDGTDVFVFSGGAARNLSDIGAGGANVNLSNLVSPTAVNQDINMLGKSLTLDADGDTTIDSSSDDAMNFATGGSVRMSIFNSSILMSIPLNANSNNINNINDLTFGTGQEINSGLLGFIFELPAADGYFYNIDGFLKASLDANLLQLDVNVDINGKSLILDADGDTFISSPVDDDIRFNTGGILRLQIINSSFNFSNEINMGIVNNIINLKDPINGQDAATKNYVDAGSNANTALSNLSTTLINQSLIPITIGTLDIGTDIFHWDSVKSRRIDFFGALPDPTAASNTGIRRAGSKMAFNLDLAGDFYDFFFDGTSKWIFSQSQLSGENLLLSEFLVINNSSADPNANGVFSTNGVDVKVQSGNVVRNLSDIGGGVTEDQNPVTWTGIHSFNGTSTSINSPNIFLGDSSSDTVSITARIGTPLIPSLDNSKDLGTSSIEWRNLFIDGTAHIDTLDIDGTSSFAGLATFNGNAVFNEDVTLGSSSVDNIVFNGEINSDFIPNASTVSIGRSTKAWGEAFIDDVITDSVGVDTDSQITFDGSLVRIVSNFIVGVDAGFSDGSTGLRITYESGTDDFFPIDSIANLGRATNRWIEIFADNVLNVSFTEFKKDIIQLDDSKCLEICKALPTIEFGWNDDRYKNAKPLQQALQKDRRYVGFNADALKTMLPHAVKDDMIYPNAVIGVLLGTVRHLEKRIKYLETK